MVNLIHCAELVITGIKYAGCDGTYKLNNTCTSQAACEVGEQPLHWSKGTASDGRQMWWCGHSDDDSAGKYTCTPWTTPACGGSFGSTDKEGAGYSCALCAPGWEGEDCKDSRTGWGGLMLLTTALCLLGYLGGGVAIGVRKNGAVPGLSAHPHRPRWAELAGLCRDGIRFTQQRLGRSPDVGGRSTTTTEPLLSVGRDRVDCRAGKGMVKEQRGKVKGKGKEKSYRKREMHRQNRPGPLKAAEKCNASTRGIAAPPIAHDGLAVDQKKTGGGTIPRAQVSEQHIVAENLHQSQAKIAVLGLNEM